MSLEILYWFLLFLPLHSYLIYPIIIGLIPCRKRESSKTKEQPSVSILISAYNEEKVISDRVQNIASCNYDFSKLEVLIGSDCSDDRTNSIITGLINEYPWLKIFVFNKRRGKAGVLNDLVKNAKNDILVFTDANTVFEKDSLKLLGEEFYDEKTGGVSGRLILVEPKTGFDKGVEEKKYWDYETLIKKEEGRCGILIGANGGIFAVRKELYREIPSDKAVTDDLYITLAVLEKKYRFLYKYEAAAYEEVPREISVEFKRKIRFSATNFQTMSIFRSLLFNQNLILTYAFWSHKIVRWFFPLIFILLYGLNIILLQYGFIYTVICLLINIFLLLSLIGWVLSRFKIHFSIFSLPYFFVMTNFALVLGFIKYLRGKHTVVWESTPR